MNLLQLAIDVLAQFAALAILGACGAGVVWGILRAVGALEPLNVDGRIS